MMYTILSAQYANADQSAAVLQTQEAGAVLASEHDTPDLWQQMLAEVTPADYVAPSLVPQSVTKRQAVQALILAGLDDDVDALLASMPGVPGKLARAEWRESNTVERDRPLVAQLGAQLGLTAQQLDDLFTQAAALE